MRNRATDALVVAWGAALLSQLAEPARPLALVAIPAAVAVGTARGAMPAVAGMALAAIAAAGIGWPLAAAALVEALAAVAAGVAIGFGLRRGTRYGVLVATACGLVYAAGVFVAATHWSEISDELDKARADTVQRLEDSEASGAEIPPASANLNLVLWYFDHWTHLYFGMLFTAELVLACVWVSVASAWARLRMTGLPVVRFTEFRPPDWLVWLLIAAALAALADYRWSLPALRPVAWNALVGLGGVYWLNGLAVVVHAVQVLRPAPILTALLTAALVLTGMLPMLAVFGLFDTWGDFRVKLTAAADARRARNDADPEG